MCIKLFACNEEQRSPSSLHVSTEAQHVLGMVAFQATILRMKQCGQKASTFNQKCNVRQCSIVHILLS